VPSSLDRKSKSKELEFEGPPLDSSQQNNNSSTSNNNNLAKYWPLGRSRDNKHHSIAAKSVSSERLQVLYRTY
jgi:hypothetical protein